jgi:hypothetical protein
VLGYEIKKNIKRGTRERIKRWLKLNNCQLLKNNLYLLEEESALIWQEFFSPLLKQHGQVFIFKIS